MNRWWILAAWLFLQLVPVVACGQEFRLSTTDKKAEKLFYSAIDAYRRQEPEQALDYTDRAVAQDPFFMDAFILRGDICADLKQYEQAVVSYESAIKTGKSFSAHLYFVLASLQMRLGKYEDAGGNLVRFLESKQGSPEMIGRAQKALASSRFAQGQVSHPVPFSPVNLGDSINSHFDEYINVITADDEKIYFTRKNPRNALTADQSQEFEEDFYMAFRKDTLWQKASELGQTINTHGNEGALFISPDGNYLFFAACDRPEGCGSCDIYQAKKKGDHWSAPENLGPAVNSPQWDSQPSFSSDGHTLYFASKRPGGKGSSDIWKTTLGKDQTWSDPVNLGDSVNTPEAEMAPFIHPDNRTLYFSSAGHPGMGGLDLFMTRKTDAGEWQSPLNLGYPINTFSDEIAFIVNSAGTQAYISSDIPGGRGRQDIYRFALYREVRPLEVTYMKGRVYDSDSGKNLGAAFELIDIKTSSAIISSCSDAETGEFLLILPGNREYALNVSRKGYLFYSDHFSLETDSLAGKPYLKDIPMKPMRKGEEMVLKNIFFNVDQSVLKPESRPELEKLFLLMQQNGTLKILISGHTDNTGSPDYNRDLSEQRARSVYTYLIDKGVDKSRMEYRGFGAGHPADTNDTVEGRANNRRTEIKITEIK